MNLLRLLGAACALWATTAAAAPFTFAPTGSLNTARSAHSTTLLSNGRVLVAGGLNAGAAQNSSEIYDPAAPAFWLPGPNLGAARYFHTATSLLDGRVLVVGGNNGTSPLATAEIYDPATNTWTPTGSMAVARNSHSATILPNGDVLVAGGFGGNGALRGAEIYNPASGTWTITGSMLTRRYFHSANRIYDDLPGGKVLVAGGFGNGASLVECELYDAETGTWSATGSLQTARHYHTASFANGSLIVAGGLGAGGAIASAERYQVEIGNWLPAGNLGTARSAHASLQLPGGGLLVVGGFGETSLTSAELYDTNTNSWAPTGSLATPRDTLGAVLLTDGKVLLAGGFNDIQSEASAELFDAAAAGWSSGPDAQARRNHAAVLLGDGRVLVVGGADHAGQPLSSAQIGSQIAPGAGSWTDTGSLNVARAGGHSATLLVDGRVLVVGGQGASGPLNGCELFDPATGVWTSTGALTNARQFHAATLLADGRVFVSGGAGASGGLRSGEIYNPTTGTWSGTGVLGHARQRHTTTLLTDGRVLAAGGEDAGTPRATVEIWHPVAGSWGFTGSLAAARSGHTATLLPSGRVLVAGGLGSGTSTELFNPATNTWAFAGDLNSVQRTGHTATLLPGGSRVLIAHGTTSGAAPRSEVYDAMLGGWSVSGTGNASRSQHTATLLPSGLLLIAGGTDGSSNQATTEIYSADGTAALLPSSPPNPSSFLPDGGSVSFYGPYATGFGSSGGYLDAATNVLLVELRSLASGQTIRLRPDPALVPTYPNFSTIPFYRSLPVSGFPAGHAALTYFLHGRRGSAGILPVRPTTTAAPSFHNPSSIAFTTGVPGSFQFSAAGAPNPTYSTSSPLPAGVSLTPAGVLSGTPGPGTGGVYPLSVTASNGVAPSASQNFVLGVNNPPLAAADVLTTPRNTAVSFPSSRLLLNDTDADSVGAVFRFAEPNPQFPRATAAGGTVQLYTFAACTYTPPLNFVGEDSFTYRIVDISGGYATGLVRVLVTDGSAPTPNLASISLEAGGTRLRWRELTTRSYRVEFSDTLTGGWIALPGAVSSDANGVIEYFDSTLPAPPRRFFRTVLVP